MQTKKEEVINYFKKWGNGKNDSITKDEFVRILEKKTLFSRHKNKRIYAHGKKRNSNELNNMSNLAIEILF